MTCVHRCLFLEPSVGSVPPKATCQNGGCIEFIMKGEDEAQRGECGSNQWVPHTSTAHASALPCLKRFFFSKLPIPQTISDRVTFYKTTWQVLLIQFEKNKSIKPCHILITASQTGNHGTG